MRVEGMDPLARELEKRFWRAAYNTIKALAMRRLCGQGESKSSAGNKNDFGLSFWSLEGYAIVISAFGFEIRFSLSKKVLPW
jgi:hypothetical protein